MSPEWNDGRWAALANPVSYHRKPPLSNVSPPPPPFFTYFIEKKRDDRTAALASFLFDLEVNTSKGAIHTVPLRLCAVFSVLTLSTEFSLLNGPVLGSRPDFVSVGQFFFADFTWFYRVFTGLLRIIIQCFGGFFPTKKGWLFFVRLGSKQVKKDLSYGHTVSLQSISAFTGFLPGFRGFSTTKGLVSFGKTPN